MHLPLIFIVEKEFTESNANSKNRPQVQQIKFMEYITILFIELITKILFAALRDVFLYTYFYKCTLQFIYLVQRVTQIVLSGRVKWED